jgi:hypothetical protein
MRVEHLPDLGVFAHDRFDRKSLVVEPKDRLDHMRKWSMPNVVQQSRNPNGRIVLITYVVFGTKTIEHPRCEMLSAQRMSET